MLAFPSPLGELYFLMRGENMKKQIDQVSVPSRGAIFLNSS